jgi:hypothetical protein
MKKVLWVLYATNGWGFEQDPVKSIDEVSLGICEAVKVPKLVTIAEESTAALNDVSKRGMNKEPSWHTFKSTW